MGRLVGKSAIITGGGRGIGRGILEAFLEEGARVLICGRSAVEDLPQGVEWRTADVAKRDQAEAVIQDAVNAFGKIDILVNNAGIQIEKTIADSTDEDWDLLSGVNMKAVFMLCRAVIPVMAGNGGGAIVNIGSISGHVSDPEMALYNASKSFVHGLTRSIAIDHGGQGIRCNAICPGWIMTEMAEAGFDLARNPAVAKADALARHAIGRFGHPSDIAEAAVWLSTDKASFVTGQTVTVDGGLVSASPLRPGLF
jgi:NAD(P)-dependent dehydrogenase (short-subunit alcohol dehydrogenase family)